jgi:hypothetical protein
MEVWIAVLGVLFAASWAVIIPVFVSMWSSLKKVKEDYQEFMADGELTDSERIHLADDVILVINDASNIYQFIVNVVNAIRKALLKAKDKRARKVV